MQNVSPNLSQCSPQLSLTDRQRFQKDGFLAFEGVLTAVEVERARTALRELTERLADGDDSRVEFSPPRLRQGNHSGASYRFRNSSCLLQLEPGFDPVGRSMEDIDLSVRKYMNFTREHEALRRFVEPGHAVRRTVESLVGEGAILFQEMALVKPAFVGSEKPWHQDNAYFSIAPLDAVVGVWIALDDAGVENGCMHVIPGGHRLGAMKHSHGSDCEIDGERLDTTAAWPVPVRAGGALFFYGMLPHETPPNRSAFRRRALQFHFRAATSEIVDAETYNRVFAEADGTPASCAAASASVNG